jgi:dTDP-4-amino-4,6-dideoxygalactose transaminase
VNRAPDQAGTVPAILGGEPAFPDRLALVRPAIGDVPALARRLEEILESGMLTNGPTVRDLEERVADRLGVAHVVGVASCTAGLMLLYQALGARHGTRVVLPSFTFAASAHAAVWTGADVDFADVTGDRCSLDVGDLAAMLQRDGRGVAAVSATHTYGHPAEVEDIDRLAGDLGVPVVYDAAHALGSRREGRAIGAFGVAEVFSLSPTKVVAAGEGGLVATNDAALAEAARLGRDYGNPGDYDCRFPGLNARMSELHAAIALSSLAHLDEHIERRAALVERFAAALAGTTGVRIVRPAAADTSTYKDLTLVVDADVAGLTAAALQAALAADGIDSRRYYDPPIHRQAAYAGRWPRSRPLPVTDRLAASVLTVPLWSAMSDHTLDRLAAALRRVLAAAPEIAAVFGGDRGGPVPSRSL